MTHQDNAYRVRLLDVTSLPSHLAYHNEQARRGWGTIIGFALSFGMILAVTLAGVGLPSPINAPPVQAIVQR
jgi:hypothetical protein